MKSKTKHFTILNFWILLIGIISIVVLLLLLIFGEAGIWNKSPGIHIYNYLSSIAALVTILGLLSIYSIYSKRKMSNECLERVIEDFIRHLWCNNALMEIFRHKMAANENVKVFPEKGFFLRFAFMDDDLNFSRYVMVSDTFDEVHRVELKMRNYNIATQVAAAYFEDPEATDEMKEKSMQYIVNRSQVLIENFVKIAPQIIGKEIRSINEIVTSRYDEMIRNKELKNEVEFSVIPLDRSQDPKRSKYDSIPGMRQLMNRYICAFYNNFDVFPFPEKKN